MPRFTESQLRDKALLALEEAVARAHNEPIEPTRLLKFALAYLARDCRDRWQFEELYKQLTTGPKTTTSACKFGRHQVMTSAMNGIYHQLGVEGDYRVQGLREVQQAKNVDWLVISHCQSVY